MKIAILGFAGQGKSAYEYWNRDGNEIVICDAQTDIEIPEGAGRQLGDGYLNGLEQFDLIVRTPILHPKDIVAANSEAILSKVTSNTNEFFKVCPTKNIIGVTGTKGKGTTSTLITKMLEATGLKVHLGGNIGIPPLNLLKNSIQPDDYVVLELANFQLIDLEHSPPIGVCLLVEAEHMDWHTNEAEYIAAKQQMFRWQTQDDKAIFYELSENSKNVVSASAGVKIPYFAKPGALVDGGEVRIDDQTICHTDELQLLGEHNWQNVCAAMTAVWQITQDVNAIRSVATSFTGLPFRIELRREVHGVRYYNDSFASAPDACLAALHAVPGLKVMIIGGYERGLDLTKLAKEFKEMEADIRHVIVIGQSGPRVAKALEDANFINYSLSQAKTMPEVIVHAETLAQEGDAVVLSPAFASFDMFKNFEDRGNKFNEAIEAL